MSGFYAGSRFAPKPRRVAPTGAAGAARTVADGQDPDGIACIRIRAHGWAGGGRIRHTVTCYNATHAEVLLSTDPSTEAAERAELLAAMFTQFPGIDWNRSHQVLIGAGETGVWAAPDADEPGFLPDEDLTFGALKPPVYAADWPWHDYIPTLPALERAA
ncbi:MAG: hypothetical protein ACJ786_21750 [Catenulispora sp.]